MVIRRFGVGSVAKVSGVLYGLGGLILGVFFALIALAGLGMGAAVNDDPSAAWMAPLFGVGAVIFFPIFYGVCGALFGAIGAALYNLVAGMIGGLQIEVE
jgi:hypothetical protein